MDQKSLLCAESFCCEDGRIAGKDNTILDDERVLIHLLLVEKEYMPELPQSSRKLCSKMGDFDPSTRKIVTKWMLEVCEQEACLGAVLPLAVNLLDRFLSKCDVPKKFLQLIAADCLLIASKIRQNLPISISTLCYYTDHSVTPCQLKNFETLIAAKLKWDLAAITAFDFIDHILRRITWRTIRIENIIRVHSTTLIHLCCTDAQFLNYKPSTMAAASIICAMKGIQMRMDADRISCVCHLVSSNVEIVEYVATRIEHAVAEEISRLNPSSQSELQPLKGVVKTIEDIEIANVKSEGDSTIGKYDEDDNIQIRSSSKSKKPETPVDVQNVEF